MAGHVVFEGASPAPIIDRKCVLYSWCRGTSRELKPKTEDKEYLDTIAKVENLYQRTIRVVNTQQAAITAEGARNVQVNFSKCYVSFEDDNGREYRLNMHTKLANADDQADLQALIQDTANLGKLLASQFKRPQNNPEADFAVTSSPQWDAIRPRNHEEFRAKGQERALIDRIKKSHNKNPFDVDNVINDARQRIENTNQFMTTLAEKLKEKRELLEKDLKDMNDPENANYRRRNDPEYLTLQKDITAITQLENMLTSIDTRGTRDAIYWAVGIGGEINDDDGPALVQNLSEKASQISQDMEVALRRPLSPEDTRGEPEKRLGINKPPIYILNDNVNNPYITAYAQDAGNLIYSGGAIENLVVHCVTRMHNAFSAGGDVYGALDALEIPFARDSDGVSVLENWIVQTVVITLSEVCDNPPNLPEPLAD